MAGIIEGARAFLSSPQEISETAAFNPLNTNTFPRRRILQSAGVLAALWLTSGCDIIPENTEQDNLENKFSRFNDVLKKTINPFAYNPLHRGFQLLYINPDFLPYRFYNNDQIQERQELFGYSLHPIDYLNRKKKDFQTPDMFLWETKNADDQAVQIELKGYFGEEGKITTEQAKIAKEYTPEQLSKISKHISKPLITTENPKYTFLGGIGPDSGLQTTLIQDDLTETVEVYRGGNFSITFGNK